MKDAVIVSTARTGIGKAARGGFNKTHGATMAGHVVAEALKRARLDPGEVGASDADVEHPVAHSDSHAIPLPDGDQPAPPRPDEGHAGPDEQIGRVAPSGRERRDNARKRREADCVLLDRAQLARPQARFDRDLIALREANAAVYRKRTPWRIALPHSPDHDDGIPSIHPAPEQINAGVDLPSPNC
jgi:hypothetical protein